MAAGEFTGWRTSSYSAGGNECVALADDIAGSRGRGGWVAVRDTKHRDIGPVIVAPRGAGAALDAGPGPPAPRRPPTPPRNRPRRCRSLAGSGGAPHRRAGHVGGRPGRARAPAGPPGHRWPRRGAARPEAAPQPTLAAGAGRPGRSGRTSARRGAGPRPGAPAAADPAGAVRPAGEVAGAVTVREIWARRRVSPNGYLGTGGAVGFSRRGVATGCAGCGGRIDTSRPAADRGRASRIRRCPPVPLRWP
ncbi:DUF397 domain-containing protein [Streptomyces bohaiensis]|uniref:DUF397 domain-containing protein n=1 Tax=Streptomyces bohaiensis TaxID=1431344 RepID=UPI003B7EB656